MIALKHFWANKNYRTSAMIVLALIIWLATGLWAEPQKPAQTSPVADSARELTEVRARRIHAKDYPLVVEASAQTQANRFVNVRAEVTGQVQALPVEEGQTVETGEVICRLALEDRAQLLSQAQAAVEQAQIDYDGAQRLESGGLQSKTAIATAKAQLESAKSNLLRRQLDVEKTAIRAPFAGVVDERSVEIGDLMRPGDSCATVIDLDPLVVSGEVSEEEVLHVKKDSFAAVRLSSGEEIPGKIRYVSRRAGEVTRTFRVEAAVDNPHMRLVSGITANLNIEVGSVPAHRVPASLLSLDDQGELGLRVLGDDERVRFYTVELVGDASDGVWVTGLPRSTLLITVGQQYVGVGEQVAVSLEEDPTAMSVLP